MELGNNTSTKGHRVYYMVGVNGDINVSTKKEKDYKVIVSYKLKNITSVAIWDKINRLITELEETEDELLRIYIFTKTFKDHLIPVSQCNIL